MFGKKDGDGGAFEGGMFEGVGKFNPFEFVQVPMDADQGVQGELEKDLRVEKLFKKQITIDFLFIRLILLAGNGFLLATDFINRPPFQLGIETAECFIISIFMIFLQFHIKRNWEAHKLPLKMKDVKANYLFKKKNPPSTFKAEVNIDDPDFMPEWNKYLPFYKFREIFLDNKLEELLNIFGRRQCKSCIEFNTGQELEEDPKRHRSFPLSPRGEALYAGMAGDFDIIDFQLQDNVYHEVQAPTVMFESVARDFSDFGA